MSPLKNEINKKIQNNQKIEKCAHFTIEKHC